MNNSCSSVNNDIYININYNDRTHGDTSDYTVTFNNTINNVSEIQLLDISAEVSDTITRNGSMNFYIRSLNATGSFQGNQRTFSINPRINNKKAAIEEFNNATQGAGCTIYTPSEAQDYDYTYATFSLTIVTGAAVTIFNDTNGFLEKYLNIPYNQIVICNEEGLQYITQTDKTYVYFYQPGETTVTLNSLESFILTANDSSIFPNVSGTYTEPLNDNSIIFFLNSINGDSFNSMVTNDNNTTNSFFILDTNQFRIHNENTEAVTIVGMSTPVRNVPLITKKFNIPIKISGLRIKCIYSDNSKYAVNEYANRGKTTLTLRVITSK